MKYKLIFTFALTLLLNCHSSRDTGNTRGVEIVENKAIPSNPNLTLKFEKDLEITNDSWFDVYFTVDGEENIYFVDIQKKEILFYKYSKNGKLLLKKGFPRGQGPDEIFNPLLIQSTEDKIMIYDKGNQRIAVFNKNLEIENLIKSARHLWGIHLDSQNNIYAYELKPTFKGTFMTFKRLSSDLKKDEIKYFEYPINSKIKDESGVSIIRPYDSFSIVRIDNSDNIWYAMSDKYEIYKVSPKGKILKKILKDEPSQPFKISEERIKKLESLIFPVKVPFKYKFEFPKNQLKICNFFILENNFLLVLTYKYDDGKHKTIFADLFDDKGIFVSTVEVPTYDRPYISDTGFFKRNTEALFRKNYFYTITMDEDSEKFTLTRYKINFFKK